MAIVFDKRSKARDYSVKKGDTLKSIADAECADAGWQALARFNWGTTQAREVVRALVEDIGVDTAELAKISTWVSPELVPMAPVADLPGKLKIPALLIQKDLPVEKTHTFKLKAIHAATALSIVDLDRWFIPEHEACNIDYALEGESAFADKLQLEVFGSNYCECKDWNKGNGSYGSAADLVDVPVFAQDLAKQADERMTYGMPDDAPWKGEASAAKGMLSRKTGDAKKRYVNVAFSPYTVHFRYYKADADKDARLILEPFWPRWVDKPTTQTKAVAADGTITWKNAEDVAGGVLHIEDKAGQWVHVVELTGDLLKKNDACEYVWNGTYRAGVINSHFGTDRLDADGKYQAKVTTFKRQIDKASMHIHWKAKKASGIDRGIVQITDGGGKLVHHQALKASLCADGSHELTWDGKYPEGVKNSLGGDTIIPEDMPYRVQIQLHRNSSAANGLALAAMHTEVRLAVHPKTRAPTDLLFDPTKDAASLLFGVAPLVPGKVPEEGDGTKWYQYKLAEYGFHPGAITGSSNADYKLALKEFKRSVPADGTAAADAFTRLVIDDQENPATKDAIKKIRLADKRPWFGKLEKVELNADDVDFTNDQATEQLRKPDTTMIGWVDGRQYYTHASAKDDANADFVTGTPAAESFGLKDYRGTFDIGDASVTRDGESVTRPWLPLRVHLPLQSRNKGLYDEPDAIGTDAAAKTLLDSMRTAVGPLRVDWSFDELAPDFSQIDPTAYDPQFTRSRRYVAWATDENKTTRKHKDTGRNAAYSNCRDKLGGLRPSSLGDYYKAVFGLDDVSLAPWRATAASSTESVATVVHDHLAAAQAKDTDLFPDAIGTAGVFFHPSRIAGDGYRVRAQVRFEPTKSYKLPNLDVLKARYPVAPLANSAGIRLWRKSSARGYVFWASADPGHWPGFMTQYRQRFRAAHVYFVHEGGAATSFPIAGVFDPTQAAHRTRFENTVKNNIQAALRTAVITLKGDYIWPWSNDPNFGWKWRSKPDQSLEDFLDAICTGTWRAFRDGLLLSILQAVEKKGFLRGHLFVEFEDSPASQVAIYECAGATKHTTLRLFNTATAIPAALGNCATCGTALADTGNVYPINSMGLPAVGIGLGATWLFTSSDENTWVHEVGHHRHLEHAGSGPGAKTALHDSQANETLLPTPKAPTVTRKGSAGGKKYSYRIIPTDGTNPVGGLSPAGTIANGAAVLDATHYNRVTWKAFPGATEYQVFRTESDGVPATTGLIGTVNKTTLDDKALAAGAAAAPPPGTWSAVPKYENKLDRGWDRHCVMSYAGCGGDYPPSNREYLCGKCLLRHRGWKVQKLGHPGTKAKEP